LAHAAKIVPSMDPSEVVIVNMSGRGDKDVDQAARLLLPEEDWA
jgi:tryptophan synthase beta chain